MIYKVIMPQGGQDIEFGRVVHWLKSEGDSVLEGELICEVETEKSIFEVEAPGTGYLRKIVVAEGDETPILSTIAYIGDLEEPIPGSEVSDVRQEDRAVTPSPSKQPTSEQSTLTTGRVLVSPRAKRLAEEKGISLDQLMGTGANGRITENDVMDFIKAQQNVGEAVGEDRIQGGRFVHVTKIRKVTASKLQQSKQTIPHFYATLSVDMTQSLRLRAEHNIALKNPDNESVSITDFIIRACALAFDDTPELNSSVFDEDRIVLWDDLNFGIAVAVGSELVVPVIEKVDQLSIGEIAIARRQLVEKAKQGKQFSLAPGRFTISNLGMFHIEQFAAIINPPETAILAVSSIEKRPVALNNQQVGLRDMLTLTLSVDHRVVDGVVACRFLNSIKALLETPDRLI
jgi:pyruvate dehydrogenase E2 component (dihydrolipoamide acetyltransferase)